MPDPAPSALRIQPVARVAPDEAGPAAGACALVVEGEIDMASAPALEVALEELRGGCGSHRFVLDFSAVRLCDSSGLRVLVDFRDRLKPDDAVTIAGISPEVAAVFEVAGLDGAFGI